MMLERDRLSFNPRYRQISTFAIMDEGEAQGPRAE